MMMTTDTIKTFFRAFVLVMMSLTVQTAWGAFVKPEFLPTDSWVNNKATGFTSGSGTQADPWVITTPAELAFFAYQVTNNQSINGVACVSAYYSLQGDIDLKDHIWVPIGNLSTGEGNNFKGNFEGNGHVIKNMMLQWEFNNSINQAIGLFSTIHEKAVVQNLVLDNAYIYNKVTTTITVPNKDCLVAPFAGAIKKNTTVQNIIVKNTKVEVTDAYNQNGKWMLFGGFIAKVLDNDDLYNLLNIYVDVDIDITKLTVNNISAVYASLFVPEFFGKIKTAPRNIYLAGKIESSANLTLIGPVFGTNLPSSSTYKDTWQLNSSNTFRYTADSGRTWTALMTKNAGGTPVETFDQTSFDSYVEKNGLCTWESTAEGLTLKQIPFPTFTKTSCITTDGTNRSYTCEVSYAEGTDSYTYKWTVDGVVQSSTVSTCSIEAKVKALDCKVEITKDPNYSYTINFTIDPLYYSIDLYADKFEGGDGTASSPYIINDDMQLAKLAHDVNKGNKYSGTYFKLGADITLDKALWMPIGYSEDASKRFGGKFDGAGHSISGMHLIWETLSGKWLNWGLFGSIMGTSDNIANYATVSNLIVKDAVLEKKAGNLPGNGNANNEGTNVAVVSGELYPYAELSNIIVKGCQITDNAEAYTNNQGQLRIGGIVGNVENQAKNNAFRIFNISADTEINLFTNATTSKAIYMSSGIGKTNFGKDNTHLFPTNLYVHGSGVTTKTATNLNCGTLFGYMEGLTPTADMQATWYYNAAGENVTYTLGNQLAFTDDNAKDFQNKANTYITDNSLSDKLLWSYDNVNHYTFGSIELTGVENKNYTITAPAGTYTWYLSSDRTNWKEITTGVSEGTNVVEIPYQEYMQYVYATDGNSISKVITVPALRITNISLSHTEGSPDYSVSVSNNMWETNENLEITYSWYKNYDSSEGATNTVVCNAASYTKAKSDPDNVKISCHVVVKYNGSVIAEKWLGGQRVVYLCPAGVTDSKGTTYTAGNDTNDGLTPGAAKLTWQGAYAALHDEGSWDENIIVLMGTSSSEATFNTSDSYKGFGILGNLTKNDRSGSYSDWKQAVEASNLNRNATITGKYGSVDYKGIIEMKGAAGQINGEQGGLGIFGDTRFENITFKHKGGQYDIFYCQYNSLEMGEGVVMTNYPNSPGYGTLEGANTMSFQVFGGINNDNRFSPLNTEALIKAMEDAMPHGREGFTMTFKSGHYSTICAGGRQNQDGLNGVMGTANMPVKCTIIMDIDRETNDKAENNDLGAHYDAGIIMAGNHEGAMFGDVDIIIRSGKVGRLVNGSLGAHRTTNETIKAPYNTYMGRAGILLDPANSENNTDGDIDGRVIVTELYGGNCGRGFQKNGEIDNPFYGYGKVVINGGTFKKLGSASDKILCAIYGAGAGGMNGIGEGEHMTPDTRIGYWDSKVMKFGTYSDASDNLLIYSCYNADTHTYTKISPLDTKTEMIINGGVFGTSSTPIDGVYAGGSGYMAPSLWTEKAVPNKDGGNIYGRAGQTVASLTINGGSFCCNNGVFAGGRGTDYYYATNAYGANHDFTDAGKTTTLSNKDYTALGQIYGNVELNINGGEFHCPVFGGGYGVADAECKDGTTGVNTLSDMALITGRSIVRINGGTFYGNVYGGGDMARIDAGADKDATYLEISSGADIRGSVFAGGRGRERREGTYKKGDDKTRSPELVGKVTGNTDVSFYGSVQKAPYIYGDIYGGGALAVVDGNTSVNLYAGNFAGEIFGGGQGKLKKEDGTVLNSADVSGNTSVLLAQDQGGQEEGEDGKLEDQFSINVIWNKLWNGTAFVTWNEENKDLFYEEGIYEEGIYKEGKFINSHNIYGGGKNACVVGTYEEDSESKITLKKGTGTATVNVLKGMTPIDLLRTREWKESYTDNKNPHFYVFGGGYGKNTKVGNTDVTVNVEGDYGIYNAETDDSDEQLAKPRAWQGAGLSSAQEAESLKVDEGQVFDNSKGIPNFTVLGVLGGGYAGTVAGDTRVEVDGKTFLHRVYGGGFGDPYASLVDDETGQVGGNTEVYVKGANIYGDVFGGGAGVASKIEADPKMDFTEVARVTGKTMVEVSDDARIFGNVYGGGDIANVGKKVYTPAYGTFPQSTTELNQTDGSFNKHEASDYQAYVNILGGDIFGEVYAGGKGLQRGAAKDYTSLGRINGNTLLHVANTESDVATIAFDENDNNIPHIWSRIYGGCAYGTVDGNTLVHIEGGMLGNNIFGGGYGYLPTTGTKTEYEMFNQVLGRKDTGKEATYANVLGNTKVQMDGGSWIWNKSADLDGNITVWDDANKQIVADESGVKPLVAELKAASAKGTEALKALLNSKGVSINPAFFDIENKIFIKSHNIFGGGNQACLVGSYTTEGSYLSDPTASLAENTGKATVELNHSPLTAVTSYDNGDVQTYSLLDPTTLAGVCWYLSINETEHPQFSVFGAGFGVNTKVGSTEVLAQPGAFLDKDGNEKTVSGTTIRYRNQRADMEVYRNFNDAIYSDYNDPKKVSTEDKIRYYGSADGTGNDPKTFLRYRSSRLAWTYGISGFTFKNIHGGGYSGYVCGGTKVVADNQLACRNIFGGGIGAQPYTASETLAEESLTNKYDFGSVKNTCVYIKSGIVSQDVFGGGVGITSNKNGETYTDFPDMARVQSGTQVHVYGEKIDVDNKEMDRTVIFGSVFGGGDAANVGTSESSVAVFSEENIGSSDFATNLNIRGGAIFSYIFAGGKGRLKSECADYTKLGGIYGNTRVIVDYPHDVMAYPYLKKDGTAYDPAEYMAGASVESTPHATPEIFNRIYGGCQNGTVYGNTLVDIENGNIGYNIFGGGWGNILDDENVAEDKRITSADVKGYTNIFINGGNALLTSYWLPDARNWEPASVKGTKVYSPQYDPEARKFKINHNIYGGGNLACEVTNTYITMAKGMLKDDTRVVGNDATPFFSTDEWKEIYHKVGSPHFSVFGGGYGEKTNVTGNTNISVNMQANKSIESKPTITAGEEYKHFVSGYSVMDVVGGGYSGKVSGDTQVNISGIFCRRIFGGGFYNTVLNTKIDIDMVDSRDIFGGGLMGDVLKSTTINVGKNAAGEANNNNNIYVHGSIYGANDVSGYVNIVLNENGEFKDNEGTGTNINIYGGHIDGNVYGAGNGDYLYALDRKGNTQVTVNEHYLLNPDDPSSEEFDLVYTVPMRETMPSYKSASDAAKIVNINSWRPLTNKVNIKIAGKGVTDKGVTDKVEIKGDVYGGGNSATVLKVNPASGEGTELQGSVTLDIGSHVNIGRVFMGCNGDALFTASEDNAFMTNFRRLNGDLTKVNGDLDLGKSIDWITDPSNKAISTLYLPTKNDERPLIYPHLLDLYFQPVEMDIQGKVLWNGIADGTGLENCTIGTFCCGGNRGNMNIYPNSDGQVFQYTFPAGLTITDKIVGGCNNANYEWKSGDSRVYHEGGYLLGLAKSKKPFIELNVNCKFQPTEADGAYMGGNVYGGCYETGTIRGDITINLKSDMLYGKDKSKLDESNKLLSSNPKYSALNVYGAGYGMESYVYGNPNVKVAEGLSCSAPTTEKGIFNPSGTSANFVYGGGQQGNVIGVTNVEVFNGHIYKSVTGGSYSGYVWGSTHVKVGYPKYYEVLFGKTGKYVLKRTDQENKDITDETTGSTSVKQYVYLVTGDMITEGVYNDIVAIDNGTYVEISDKKSYFEEKTTDVPSSVGWNNINIKIGEAVYGGGYSLAHGASVMANNTTVLKFTDKYNLDAAFTTNDEHKAELAALPGSSTKGFGGNTTILVADRVVMPASPEEKDNVDRDHITISHQEMKAVTDVASGTDLQGYYYKDSNGNYRYIYMAGKYYMGSGGKMDSKSLPSDIYYEDKDNKKNPDLTVYEYDNEGGIFGDGHLSYAEGFRSADLTGYGFASSSVSSPKILNTFQRMDILRLTDNCFTLLGARDYATNSTDKTPYSVSRVGEIQMVAKNIAFKDEDGKQKLYVGSGNELTARRARNYMGFANNIRYVGAVNSDVAFTENMYDGKGELQTGTSYKKYKQDIIDGYFTSTNGNYGKNQIFEKRNNGTAKNMIGIASGYALKIQNLQETVNEKGEIIDKPFYGPIYGVIEMNLIDVREDEGGGYVYADNIHKRAADDTKQTEDFLETTGNFVFPELPNEARFIVDDCFPTGYQMPTTSTGTAGAKQFMSGAKTTEEASTGTSNGTNNQEIHYWYVTGYNYYYNAHITGYTSKQKNKFLSANDAVMVLSGIKPGQEINIIGNTKLVTDDDNDDLSSRNYKEGEKDKSGTSVEGKYNLYISAPADLLGKIGFDEVPTFKDGFVASLAMERNGKNEIKTQKLSATDKSYPQIRFMLTDEADNSSSEYYKQHLSKPYKAKIILTAPAMQYEINSEGKYTGNLKPVTDYLSLKGKVYTKNEDNTYSPVSDATPLAKKTTYYYRTGDFDLYQEIKNLYSKTTTNGNVTWNKVEFGDVGATPATLYSNVDRNYTYTIDLTIEYVQGPDINGNITIDNCALPGEMIRLKKDKVTIDADESFAANGYYWRIGKDFRADEEWKTDGTATNYSIYKVGDEKGTGLFAGCYYNTTEDYLEVPAYYFMNGYKVQLGISMNQLDGIFSAPMTKDDHLVVHNYHQMDPHATGVDLHLAEAVARAYDNEDTFAEPRVYISDQQDLRAFTQFIDTIGAPKHSTTVKIGGKDKTVPKYGEKVQFVFQNNITAPEDYTAPQVFKGIIHGNGNVLSGLAPGKCFINDNQGQIYNLGLASGQIASGNTNGGTFNCCFEYRPSSGKPVVYRLDGTKDENYTDEDFRYGKVAYDLNQYYLEARHTLADNTKTLADNANLQYVKDYFANGDYQYAFRKDELTGNTTGIKYLRTGSGTAIYPNYGNYETRHDKTHAIDCPRAHGYVAAHEATQDDVTAGKASSVGEMVPESRTGNYEPLFNAEKHSDAPNVTNTEVMNDYIFWGQSLQSMPDDYPSRIHSNQVSNMTNRVYRAAGYYRDTNLSTFHYNAFKRDATMMSTYVYLPATTAIDFTCQNDLPAAVGYTGSIYYPPVKDVATKYHNLVVKPESGVSRNLLVYTSADDKGAPTDAYDAVYPLNYKEETPETNIQLHHIVQGSAGFSTQYLHLVERADELEDNNDFCAPIEFSVTDRAWYARKPKYYSVAANDAWEGICLPFTVNKAEASVNGEITHFYGTAPAETAPAENHWNLHHEYWLRGMTAVSAAGDKATFKRPGTGLFEGGGTTGITYTFDNTFFVDTYGKDNYNYADNAYYATPQTWTDYLPLTANVPYIMSLPGKRYYEFDLTSEFYNRTNPAQPAQTVTFNAYGDKGTITISKTGDMKTNVSSYDHTGTFISENTEAKTVYGINATGTAFDDAAATILPFRTYIRKTASGAKPYSPAVSVISIAETRGIDTITPEGGEQADEQPDGNYILVAPAGRGRISVESTFATTLKVFTPSGQLYRILDVRPGTATYSGFQPGLYIVGKVKVRVM